MEKKENRTKAASVPVWTWRDAIRQASVAPLTKLVCYTIANYLSDAGKGWLISVAQLAEDSGLSNRSVSTHLQAAADAGLLEMERVSDSRGYRCGTRFKPRFPEVCELASEPADMHVAHDEPEAAERAENQAKSLDAAGAVELSTEGYSRELGASLDASGASAYMQEVHDNKEAFNSKLSNLSNTPPLPPARRGARAGGLEEVLKSIRSAETARVVDRLLAPLARQRRVHAPDVGFALGALATSSGLARLDDEGLDRVLRSLLVERKDVVKPSDVECHERQEQPHFEARRLAREIADLGRRNASTEARSAWSRILAELPRQIGTDATRAWFPQVAPIGLDDGHLRLVAGTRVAANWIESKLADKVIDAAAAAGIAVRSVSVVHRLHVVAGTDAPAPGLAEVA